MARTPSSKPDVSRRYTDPATAVAEADRTISGTAGTSTTAQLPAALEGQGDPNAYTVGYRRPPLHSRFKRGQSGNPKGREMQSRNMRTVMKHVLNQDMQIREGGRVRRMPTFEALVRTTLSRAFKGDPKAMASLLVLVRHCGYGTDSDESAVELLSSTDLKTVIDDYIDRNVAEHRTDLETTGAKDASDVELSTPQATPKKPK